MLFTDMFGKEITLGCKIVYPSTNCSGKLIMRQGEVVELRHRTFKHLRGKVMTEKVVIVKINDYYNIRLKEYDTRSVVVGG